MNKKMCLLKLKLKEQGLAVLLLFVFTSCDQLLPTSGSGVDIPVKIRAVNVSGGDQTEITTRASGESERRIIGEPIVQDLGGGMLAEITVEEDIEALRKGDKSLTTNAWFRIIAIENSSGHYLSHADFQAKTGDGYYTDDNLHVPSGMACDFICFSYNSTTVSLPAANYTVGSTLPTHTMDGSTDFLYQRITETIDGSNSALSFDDLKHQLAKVTLIFDTSYNNWPITAVNSNALPTIGSVAIPSAFTLTNTTPPSGSAATQTLAGWPATFGSDQTEATSGELRVVPKSSGTLTIKIPQGAVTLSGPSTALQPTAVKTISISSMALEKGRSYTFRLKPYAPKFAGSNIYWNGNELTFDAHGSNANTKYQGVYFKWGSLIGISPVGSFSSGTTASSGQTDGTTIYMKVNGEWKKTNVAYATSTDPKWLDWWRAVPANTTDSAAWNAIPSYYGTSITESALVGNDAYSLLAKSDIEHYKGDICNYINPAYRMPTRNELIALYNSNYQSYYKGFTSSSITDQTADGKTAFTAQFGTFTGLVAATNSTYYLPASGYRYSSSGALYDVGLYGYYWSGSAYSGTNGAYELYFNSSGYAYTDYSGRSNGRPVRCVLIE